MTLFYILFCEDVTQILYCIIKSKKNKKIVFRTENEELHDLIVLHKLDNNMQLSIKFHEDFGIFHSLNGLNMPNRLYVSLLCKRI